MISHSIFYGQLRTYGDQYGNYYKKDVKKEIYGKIIRKNKSFF